MSDEFDVVCIGSGIAALSYALARLIRAPGTRLLIVEKHRIPGGYATGFFRPRLTSHFEVSLHKLTGMGPRGNLRATLDRLGVLAGLDLVFPDTVFAARQKGCAITVPASAESARKVLLEVLALPFDATPPELGGRTVADVLLEPTIIYAPAFRAMTSIAWKAAAHITGGGLVENPPRIFGDDALAVELDPATWDVPGVIRLIATAGVAESELRRTLAPVLTEILETVKAVLEDLPLFRVIEVLEEGIHLSGGGALLAGMRRLIEEATGHTARVVEDPLRAVIRGAKSMLGVVSELDLWER